MTLHRLIGVHRRFGGTCYMYVRTWSGGNRFLRNCDKHLHYWTVCRIRKTAVHTSNAYLKFNIRLWTLIWISLMSLQCSYFRWYIFIISACRIKTYSRENGKFNYKNSWVSSISATTTDVKLNSSRHLYFIHQHFNSLDWIKATSYSETLVFISRYK
jgi:hypothetical protein